MNIHLIGHGSLMRNFFMVMFLFVIVLANTFSFAQEEKGPKALGGAAASSNFIMSKGVVEAEDLLAAGADEPAEKKLSIIVEQSKDRNELTAAHFWLGNIYTRKYQLEKAAEHFLKGFDASNNSLYGGFNLYNLARTMSRLNKIQESCKIYMKYIEVSLNKEALYLDSMKDKAKAEVEKNCRKASIGGVNNG